MSMGVKGLKQVKCSCLNCQDIVAVKQLFRHYPACLVRGGKFIGRKYPNPISMNCQYCNKLCKNANSLRQHEIRCLKNPNKIAVNPKFNNTGRVGKNQYIKAKDLGLPKPTISKETRKKLAVGGTKIIWSDEKRQSHSESMKNAVKNNPESYSSSNRGRTKQIIYDGIKFIGQWELDFYIWSKNNSLNPQRPSIGFPYIWNGDRTYFPDFYLPTLDVYVEVKGYETDRDIAKWSAFTNKLCIVKKMEIKDIRNGSFDVDKLLNTCYNVG
jgi:hypothetical protein